MMDDYTGLLGELDRARILGRGLLSARFTCLRQFRRFAVLLGAISNNS
jgi:hypothetical protein